jgi:hypothetical protein
MREDEIVRDFPYVEKEGFQAVYGRRKASRQSTSSSPAFGKDFGLEASR